MNTKTLTFTVSVLSLLALMPAYARNDGTRHRGYDYNPVMVETRKGEVASLEHAGNGRHHNNGLHLVLKTGKDSITVYLGPEDCLEGKMVLAAGDTIEVTGSIIDDNGGKALVAREIRKGSTVVVLRKNDGTPLWSGSGMRQHRR
jgi:hypothetical protein